MAPSPRPHNFLHRMDTSGVKLGLYKKISYLTWQLILQKSADIAKIIAIFAKRSIVNVCKGSEYALDSEYARVLNIPGFWVCQDSEYTSSLKMLVVLSMPGFWIYQGFKYVKVTQGSD